MSTPPPIAGLILAGGERKIDRWVESQPHAIVDFPDAEAFANINTREELTRVAPNAEAERGERA